VSNTLQLVGDYTNPILKPEAAEVVKKFGEMSLAQFGYPIPRNQCWPGGTPFILPVAGIQMFQQPHRITMFDLLDRQIPRIRMSAQHRAQVSPS